jgi:HlyD family secretion protein
MNARKIFTRQFYTRKKLIWGAVIVVVLLGIGFAVFGKGHGTNNIQTDTVKRQDIQQTVLSTGQVVSNVDLNLSFQGSGVVRQVLVKEGSHVQAGTTLATLDQASALASLATARGSLAQAQANYDKIVAGASNEDIEVSKAAVATAQTALDNAKQSTLVNNAYSVMLNSGLAAIPTVTNSSAGTIAVSGTYNGQAQGQDTITIVGSSFDLKGTDTGYATIIRGVALPLDTHGLYVTFSPAGSFNNNDTWTISIPNTESSTYLANYNAYQAALQAQNQAIANAQAALDQAQAALALKQAQARPPDVEAAQASILSAQGQVDAAQALLSNTVLRAPSAGTITQVDTKVGEQANALQEVIILQDVTNLHAEANVSEADIASIKIDQAVDYTFDALGPDRHFAGAVQVVNPASTVISGVVNYKVTASIKDAPDIKPGMTANMTIMVAQKSAALTVPSTAILNMNGDTYVRVIDDAKKKTYHEVQVQTGLNADGGLVEITSGLSEGQEVVTSIQ